MNINFTPVVNPAKFPAIYRSKWSGVVVLFDSPKSGTVLVGSDKLQLGKYYTSFVSVNCRNDSVWELLSTNEEILLSVDVDGVLTSSYSTVPEKPNAHEMWLCNENTDNEPYTEDEIAVAECAEENPMFRYLIVSRYGDLPVGTNDRETALLYAATEDYYVVDIENNHILYTDTDSVEMLEVTKEE